VFRRVVVAAVLLATASPAVRALEVVTPPPAAVAAVMKQAAGISEIVAWFRGPSNLYGLAGRFMGKPVVLVTDGRGSFLATGVFIDTNTDRDLIGEATRQFFAADVGPFAGAKALPDVKPLSSGAALDAFAFIPQGRKATGAVAYVLFDFACGHCQDLYRQIGAADIAGELRWVPLKFSAAGASKAALALGKSSLDGIWAMDEKTLATAVQSERQAFITGALAAETNTTTANELGASATPFLIFKRDGAWVTHSGVANKAAVLAELGLK